MKKYELVENDMIKIGRATLYRIRALIDFNDVKAGDLGGYVETEHNLCNASNYWCWIYNDAKVYGEAIVYENAIVAEKAKVYGSAEISGSARIYGNAKVYGHTKIFGRTEIFGDAKIHGHTEISGHVKYRDSSTIAEVYENDDIKNIFESFDDIKIKSKVLNLLNTLAKLSKEQSWVFDMANNILIEVLDSVSEKKRWRFQRQREGIEAAKKKGKYLGRPSIPYPDKWEEYYKLWKAGNITAKKFMVETNLKRSTFYKLVKNFQEA